MTAPQTAIHSTSSDALSSFRELITEYPLFSVLCQLYRVRFVVDANVILSDVRWLAKRRNPEARTHLQEVLAAGTVVAFAPDQLDAEVRRHIPRIARKEQVEVSRLEAEWAAYRTQIRFRTPMEGERPAWVQDPDDLPYMYLAAQIGAEAIYTHDSDLAAMGASVVGADVVIALRDYSRATSLEVTIKVGGAVVVLAGGIAFQKLWEWMRQFASALGRLPAWVKWVVAAAVVAAVVHPRGRLWIKQAAACLPDRLGTTLRAVGPLVGRLIVEADSAKKEAAAALKRAHLVGRSTPQPVHVHALRICEEEGRPLRLEEMARRVLQDGYVTRARDFPSYLRRVLRARGEFVEAPKGYWGTATVPA